MAIETVALCDCCNKKMSSANLPDVMILTAVREVGEIGKELITLYYGYECGCAQRITHAVELEIAKHDKMHTPPSE